MLASIPSANLLGVDGHRITVEVHVSVGIPSFTLVGLPDASCREANSRVRAALTSSGIRWPNKRITVNLAPSSVRKVGSSLDLAIAIGLLVANGDIPPGAAEGVGFIGELGLDGTIRSVPGVLSLVGALDCPAIVVGPTRTARPCCSAGTRCSSPRRSPSWSTPCRVSRHGPIRRPSRPTLRCHPSPTSPMCADSRWLVSHSRSRLRVGITCCSSGHPVPARRCSPVACPASFPTSTTSPPSTRRASTRPRARRCRAVCSFAVPRSALRIMARRACR